jgi:glutamine synthetase
MLRRHQAGIVADWDWTLGAVVEQQEREQQAAAAESLVDQLDQQGVVGVAATWVDNSGVTRVKAVPLGRLSSAAAWGIGASPVFDAFLVDDSIASGRYAGGPVGDLRLHPDLSRLTVLAEQPGWAWAPADRYTQDGVVHPQDQRSLAKRAVAELSAAGCTAKFAFEVEWAVGEAGAGGAFVPAAQGPAYGFTRLSERSDYLRDLLLAFTRQGVAVDQIHPEYGAGQFEISVAAEDPVGAADTFVLVRETIRATSARHGMRASFSPKVLAEGVGNGGHVHLSVWRGDENLFTGGSQQHGLTDEAAAFTAGILERLPALLAIGAPSVASYLRLIPQHWAGAFQAWGPENRETALRVVAGSPGNQNRAANLEVKAFDQAANPYLVVAALLYTGLAGVRDAATLPPSIDVDPASLSEHERAKRGIVALPTSLSEVTDAFEADPVLTAAFGTELAATIVDVRRAEVDLFADAKPEDIAEAVRWRH